MVFIIPLAVITIPNNLNNLKNKFDEKNVMFKNQLLTIKVNVFKTIELQFTAVLVGL